MTRIRATCPSCGEVDLRPTDIELKVVRTGEGEVSEGSHYRFECPSCTEQVSKPADERIARLLATGGVAVSVETELDVETIQETFAELTARNFPHPEDPGDGPAFTPDDLLDFHQLLESDSWFDELSATTA